MSRSFDILTESPARVQQIHAAFGREDYWLARIAAGDATITTTLYSLLVDADGTVTVRVTQHLGRQLLPGLVAKFGVSPLGWWGFGPEVDLSGVLPGVSVRASGWVIA
jgi:Protein of unknown function (DUF2505)